MGDFFPKIFSLIKDLSGYNFSGYKYSIFEKCLRKRISATKCKNIDLYLEYIEKNIEEINLLRNALIINVTSFFRDSLTFEFIASVILPGLVNRKIVTQNFSIRVWSAGCSTGEEAYSIAILIDHLISKNYSDFKIDIFGTDIDEISLKRAINACYPYDKMKNIKLELLHKYFVQENEFYKLKKEIISIVNFSVYDMLDPRNYVPPESIYGNFDIVFCKNVLIYYQKKYQNIIFKKLYRSIANNGFLILDKSESPGPDYNNKFIKINRFCNIYEKI